MFLDSEPVLDIVLLSNHNVLVRITLGLSPTLPRVGTGRKPFFYLPYSLYFNEWAREPPNDIGRRQVISKKAVMSEHLQSLDHVIETFSLFDDWEDRYRYLIDLGKTVPDFPENGKTEANLVRGCTSRVWMISSVQDGKLHFDADSDAHIVRGLIGLLIVIYQDKALSEIALIDVNGIFNQLGLEQNLSPNRRNGFFSMVEKISALA